TSRATTTAPTRRRLPCSTSLSHRRRRCRTSPSLPRRWTVPSSTIRPDSPGRRQNRRRTPLGSGLIRHRIRVGRSPSSGRASLLRRRHPRVGPHSRASRRRTPLGSGLIRHRIRVGRSPSSGRASLLRRRHPSGGPHSRGSRLSSGPAPQPLTAPAPLPTAPQDQGGSIPQQWPAQPPQTQTPQGWPAQPSQPPQQWTNPPQTQHQSEPAPQQWPGGPNFPQPVQPPQQWPDQTAYRPSPPGQGYNQSQPVPQPAPMRPQQAPQRPPAREDDTFFSASRAQSHAPIIVVGARKGGVGKTSTSLGIAQRGAECGLKVVLVDANMGQGGSVSVRLRIHKAGNLPTIYDAAMSNNPRRSFIMPEEVNEVRNQLDNLDDVAFSLVQAPTSQTSSREIVTNAAYLEVIRYAQRHADLVVVDTQIIEAEAHRPDSLFWDKLVPLIRNNEAWLVCVTEDDRESVKNTLETCRELSEGKQIPRSHILTIFNLFDPGIVNTKSANRTLKAHSVPVGIIDRIDSIKKRFSAGYTPTSIPEFIPVLNNVLRHVTGDSQMFPRHEAVIEREDPT